MRFGDVPEPRVYSWGNPGVPRTSFISNSTLAAGRATEGGKFSRNYVPMHDASTTEPVVRQVRWPQSEHDKHMYKSLTVLTDWNGNGHAENVIAIDRGGRMWTWGRDYPTTFGVIDPTGLGGPSLPPAGMQTRHLMTRPVRVLTPAERDTGVTHTWTKVQARAFQPCSVALTSGGKLYATGNIQPWYFLDEHRTANVSVTCFTQISTQTWSDFATFGASLLAIRDDGTLHERGIGLSKYNAADNTAASPQVTGIVSDVYFDGPYIMSSPGSFVRFTLNAPPAAGRQATIGTARNTATGEVRPYVENHGAGYTAASIVSTLRFPSNSPSPPTLRINLATDTAWTATFSNGGDAAILFTKPVGTAGGRAYQLSTRDHVPDGGFFSTYGSSPPLGLTNLRFPTGVAFDGNTHQSFVDSFEPEDPFAALSPMNGFSNANRNFAIRTNRSGNANSLATNFLVWGTNGSGCLAVGHTNPQRTITLSRSYRTAASNQAITLEKLALADNHSVAIGRNPVRPTEGFGKMYCAGQFEFAGNSAVTTVITSFTPVTPASANTTGRYWYSCFASGTRDEQLSIASRDYVAEDGRDDVLA